MAFPEWKQIIFSKKGALNALYNAIKTELTAIDTRIDSVEAGTVAEGSISEAELANGAVSESKLATGAVTSGKLGTGAVATAKLADAAANAVKIKHVERVITIAGGSATGTATAAEGADVNAVPTGIYPLSGCESPIKDFTFDSATGAITVELMSAQGAENEATVGVRLIQA